MAEEIGDETRGKSGISPGILALLIAVSLVLLYVLSPIPVAFAVNHWNHRNYQSVSKFYAPFGWAQQHTPLRRPIDKYAEFISRL